jgi:hypothetical protein
MPKKSGKQPLPIASKFSAVSCSGFFIDPALVTAACILFEEIHLLNDIEYAVAFAKRFKYKRQAIDATMSSQVMSSETPRGVKLLATISAERFLESIPENEQVELGITSLTPSQLYDVALYRCSMPFPCEVPRPGLIGWSNYTGTLRPRITALR